jgi:hypothetical protein
MARASLAEPGADYKGTSSADVVFTLEESGIFQEVIGEENLRLNAVNNIDFSCINCDRLERTGKITRFMLCKFFRPRYMYGPEMNHVQKTITKTLVAYSQICVPKTLNVQKKAELGAMVQEFMYPIATKVSMMVRTILNNVQSPQSMQRN